MRVFITGASGWIGSAVVADVQRAGHDVVGLARSDAAAATLHAVGAAVHRGSLDDLDSLRAGAAAADGVIHLAFKHDFADYAGAGRTERAAVEALCTTLEGTDRPLLVASGVAGLAAGRLATEHDRPAVSGPDAPRGDSEGLALGFTGRGVRAVGVRFAPTVHGQGDHGFVATLVGIAVARGRSGYVGTGENRWPAVHRDDAARLVRLALEQAPAGTVVHAVAEEGVATRSIAASIGRRVDVPVVSVAEEDVTAHFGWIGRFFSLDMPTSSSVTRADLGWSPTGPTLLEDLAAGAYLPPDRAATV